MDFHAFGGFRGCDGTHALGGVETGDAVEDRQTKQDGDCEGGNALRYRLLHVSRGAHSYNVLAESEQVIGRPGMCVDLTPFRSLV